MKLEFGDYLRELEQRVVVEGIIRGTFGQIMNIPTKAGKLNATPFGQRIGQEFPCEAVCAIDYYGHFKRSSSFMALARQNPERAFQTGIVVHFAGVRTQHVIKLAPELVMQFPDFKEELLALRGFR